jgi:hypothetical protein
MINSKVALWVWLFISLLQSSCQSMKGPGFCQRTPPCLRSSFQSWSQLSIWKFNFFGQNYAITYFKDSTSSIIFIKTKSRAGSVAQEVEHLPSKPEGPSSAPSTAKKKRKEKKKKDKKQLLVTSLIFPTLEANNFLFSRIILILIISSLTTCFCFCFMIF